MSLATATTKVCKNCGTPKRQRPGGKWYCGPCDREGLRRSYEKHKTKRRAEARECRQKNAGKRKADRKERYWKDPETARAKALEWQQRHRKQRTEAQRAWCAKNPDKCKGYGRKWREANREQRTQSARRYRKENPDKMRINKATRRARERGRPSPNIVQVLLKKQKERCVVCRGRLRDLGYHLDHIMPLAREGTNVDSNLQLLCPPCNYSKNDRDPIEFMQSRGFLL